MCSRVSVRHLHGSSFCSFALKTGYKGIGLTGQFCYDYQAGNHNKTDTSFCHPHVAAEAQHREQNPK